MTAVTGRVFAVASQFLPGGSAVDGTQAAMFWKASDSGVYQNLGHTYQPGFRYRFSAFLGLSQINIDPVNVELEFRDGNDVTLASRTVTRFVVCSSCFCYTIIIAPMLCSAMLSGTSYTELDVTLDVDINSVAKFRNVRIGFRLNGPVS